jgi:amino acid permease
MNFKNLMIAETLVCFGFGLIYIFFPQYLIDEYLTDKTGLNDTVRIIGMHYGSLMLCIGILQFYCRNAQPSFARKAILFIPLLSNFFVVLISFYGLSANIENNMIWTVIVPLLFMSGWAGWLLWKERDLKLS